MSPDVVYHVGLFCLQLLTIEDGDMRSIWEALGVPVTELQVDQQYSAIVDWLNYDGIIAMSLNMKCVLSRWVAILWWVGPFLQFSRLVFIEIPY
jgi:hypothetical protein